MKCAYKFKVSGELRAVNLTPVKIRGFEFQFIAENEFVTHLTVTVPANDVDDIPKVIQNPSPGVKAHVQIPAPCFLLVQREVRSIEVLLSVFGLHSIDLNNFVTEWIPESVAEKSKLKINHFETFRGSSKKEDMPILPFDILVRSIIAADDASDVEVSLSFFRKGLIDMSEERYIEAFYDYYFFLESFFGEGKTKNQAVQEAFKNAEPLRSCIDQVIKDQDSGHTAIKDHKLFIEKFNSKTVDQIIDHIVGLRGFLHHHSAKRKGGWHPDDHNRFKFDALLLHHVSYRIAMETVFPRLYHEKTTAKCKELFGLK